MGDVGGQHRPGRGREKGICHTAQRSKGDKLAAVLAESSGNDEDRLQEATRDVHSASSKNIRYGTHDEETGATRQGRDGVWPKKEVGVKIEVRCHDWKTDHEQTGAEAVDEVVAAELDDNDPCLEGG